MIGYRAKDGFHLILENGEASDLILLVSEGVQAVKKWNHENKKLHIESVAEADNFNKKLGIIFAGDNYNGSSSKRPIIARPKVSISSLSEKSKGENGSTSSQARGTTQAKTGAENITSQQSEIKAHIYPKQSCRVGGSNPPSRT